MRHEILVVDGPEGNPRQESVCQKAGARYIRRRPSGAYADAVATGIRESRGESVLFMDADGSHRVEDVLALWAARDQGDLIIGSRYAEGGATDNSLVLRLMSMTVNVIFRFFLGLNVRDVSNSLRLYRRADVAALNLRSTHFDVIEEILAKLVKRHPGYRLVEVPAHFKARYKGETKRDLFTFALGYVFTLCRLMFYRFVGR